MNYFPSLRRAIATAASTALLASLCHVVNATPIPDDVKIGGFAIGAQAYTFNRFSVFEAIEKTEQAGGMVIEFYPGQKLSADMPTVKWDHNASDEIVAKVKEKLAKHHVRAVNYGVVGIPKNEAEARKIFEFAKKMELYGITTESVDAIDTIDKLVKEFDIRVGYHEHGRNPSDPNYKVWDPKFIAELVKDRDPRVGACADIGHWQTSGMVALDCMKILSGRIISMHMKDRPALGPGQHDVVFGSGITDIGAVLAELRKQKFDGNISIEYEYNWDHSVGDVGQCIGFVRGWSSTHPQ
ncbi:MAG TPA: sugar phosphate isomerase/epimerase [Candidatus Limnocylindria bacterium]|jgi:sugar phosphate isomerase/epimerase|nr:sugar phosphate isomerase/epimerase [Candidatus Limnocylindria bacterium]